MFRKRKIELFSLTNLTRLTRLSCPFSLSALVFLMLISFGCVSPAPQGYQRETEANPESESRSEATEMTIPLGALNLDIVPRVVGMQYMVSHDMMLHRHENQGKIFNLREFLEQDLWNRDFGPVRTYHYWDKPALGYYSPMDDGVLEQQILWMMEADIDLLIIDNTNVMTSWYEGEYALGLTRYELGVIRPQTHLLETLLDMRNRGHKTPHVVFWQHTNAHNLHHDLEWSVRDVHLRFYQNPRYQQLFAWWEGKPFLLVAGQIPPYGAEHFTVRRMWGLRPTVANREWVFIDDYPQRYGRNNREVEQVGITASPHMNYQTSPGAVPRSGGKTFQEQWSRAFELQPKFVTLNMFNLWASVVFYGAIPGTEGQLHFTDTFTREFSMDLEPMTGGHGDLYLRWTGEFARAFKEGRPQPQLALDRLGLLYGHYPLYEHRDGQGIGAFGPADRRRSEAGQTMLGLQSSQKTYDPKPPSYHGQSHATVMFDTMTANLFSEGWISLRLDITENLVSTIASMFPALGQQHSEPMSFGASFYFEAPENADQNTQYPLTIRFLPGRETHKPTLTESPTTADTIARFSLKPGQWNRVEFTLPDQLHDLGDAADNYRSESSKTSAIETSAIQTCALQTGTLEFIFHPQGPGTTAWYGNLGVDYLTLDWSGETYILEDFEREETNQ